MSGRSCGGCCLEPDEHRMTASAPVLIVGAGPVGLALAIELGHRGVACLVEKPLAKDVAEGRFPEFAQVKIL